MSSALRKSIHRRSRVAAGCDPPRAHSSRRFPDGAYFREQWQAALRMRSRWTRFRSWKTTLSTASSSSPYGSYLELVMANHPRHSDRDPERAAVARTAIQTRIQPVRSEPVAELQRELRSTNPSQDVLQGGRRDQLAAPKRRLHSTARLSTRALNYQVSFTGAQERQQQRVPNVQPLDSGHASGADRASLSCATGGVASSASRYLIARGALRQLSQSQALDRVIGLDCRPGGEPRTGRWCRTANR